LYLYLLAAFLLNPSLHQSIINKLLDSTNHAAILATQTVYLIGLLGLLALSILLTQRTHYLDRHYIYLQGVEDRIKLLSGYTLVPREGDFYILERIPEERRISSSLPYAVLYDLVFIVLIGGVLIDLWIAILKDSPNNYRILCESGSQLDLFHKWVFMILSAAFVIILVLFLKHRKKIKMSHTR
jgi:hypothetical protein